ISTTPAHTAVYTFPLHGSLPIFGGGGHGERRLEILSRAQPEDRPDLAGRARRHEHSRIEPQRQRAWHAARVHCRDGPSGADGPRSEEHTSELQSRFDLVCALLLE